MPLVANSKLPTFRRLNEEGEIVLDPGRAEHQDIRELHIGLLNMMPDAALSATERQFFRLVGGSNQIAQFHMHPFSLPAIPRSAEGQTHVEHYYETFETIQRDGLDALIITGANVTQPDLAAEPFWNPLIEVVEWASQYTTSILCSCLATHAVAQFRYGQRRQHLDNKRWGVFQHRVIDKRHPLVSDVNTVFDVPHSRFNAVTPEQFTAAGLPILVQSEQAGVHLAVSEDRFRCVFFQGHPEYDTISLLKEYKREINRFTHDHRDDYPPFPDNYFCPQNQAILSEYRDQLVKAKSRGAPPPLFPEQLVLSRVDNTWHDTAEAVVNNWIGKVYQLTNNDRKLPFMEGVDPENPLGLR